MSYIGFADQFQAKAAAHRETLLGGGNGDKLYLDGFKVTIKGDAGILEIPDGYELLEDKYKQKVKLTIEDAEGDKVDRVKAKVKIKNK